MDVSTTSKTNSKIKFMYRVKEQQGIFIPQKWSWFKWEGIDRYDNYNWFDEDNQIKWCKWQTLQEARERIKSYKEQNKKPKYKIHSAR